MANETNETNDKDLVARAKEFATSAHRRIDHRRKYTSQPYDAHLRAVAEVVATVTDDPQTLAAAWLHDTLEDTPATYEEIESEFGRDVADLVGELTDVSRPTDGNRAVRKAIDRRHLARASDRAKTVKLADLIDNCADIVKHDPGFGRVFVAEAAALLEVLGGGDGQLLARARKLVGKSADKLGLSGLRPEALVLDGERVEGGAQPLVFQHRVLRLFVDCFRATDIAEPLKSFDANRDPADIARVLRECGDPVAGLRKEGVITGYARREDLEQGAEARRLRAFGGDQVLDGNSSLSDVIFALTRYDHCFVRLLGDVVGFVSRSHMQNPVVRMWLFGIVTLTELELTEQIRTRWPDGDWTQHLSKGRREKAEELVRERERRGIPSGLLDCLQFSDKAHVLIQDQAALAALGFRTRRTAKQVIRELESLRNHLAHAQDIVTHDWPQIVRLVSRIEEMARAQQEAGDG